MRAGRSRGATVVPALCLLGLAVILSFVPAVAAPAGAATAGTFAYTQGLPGSPFTLAGGGPPATIALGGGIDPYLTLATGISLVFDARTPGYAAPFARDPRSVQALPGGDLLIADRQNDAIYEIRPNGSLAWSYTTADDPAMKWPFFAQRLANGNTLITDRSACHVFEVTRAKRIVWQYGSPPSPIDAPPGVNQLADPFSAVRTDDGKYTFICDNKATNRVIKVRDADYAPSKANDGYTAASIVWQYGLNGPPGDGPGQLNSPRSAQLLKNGDVLICSSETQANGPGANRVIEVRARDYDKTKPNFGYTTKSIVWQYSSGRQAGDALADPNQAFQTADGVMFIADSGNNRVLGVDKAGNVVFRFGSLADASGGGLLEPRGISLMPDGRLAVADQGNHRVVAIGAIAQASVASGALSLGFPGQVKELFGISWSTQELAGTGLTLAYRIDAGPWRSAGDAGDFEFPAGTRGRTISYRATFTTRDRTDGARLDDVTIRFGAWTGHVTGGSGTGTGGPRTNGGAGVAGYGVSAGVTTGGEASSGAGGTGSSGGAGGGDGSPAQGGATGGGSGVSGPVAGIPTQPQSSAAGTGQQVSGLSMQQGGGAADGGGGGLGPRRWRGLLAAALPAALVALAASPWVLVGRRRRQMIGYDHVVRRRLPATRIRLLED